MTFQGRVQALKFCGLLMVLFTVAPFLQQALGFGPLTLQEIFWSSVVLFTMGVVSLVFAVQHALALSRMHR
jgi:hypothetical protein